ncbi:hypothetical protein [Tetragenococcus halophilus]|nr:hypothetical protein [Tetragenococcus halophilus]
MNKFLKIFPVILGVLLLVAVGFWYESSMGTNEEKTRESTTETSQEVVNEPQKDK